MARGSRRRPLTRDDLLNRYATIAGATYGEAHDLHAETEIEDLRSIIETLESTRRPTYAAQRASFAKSQPTTSLQGQTR